MSLEEHLHSVGEVKRDQKGEGKGQQIQERIWSASLRTTFKFQGILLETANCQKPVISLWDKTVSKKIIAGSRTQSVTFHKLWL